MKRIVQGALHAAAAGLVALGLASAPARAADRLKVGFVYVGPVSDYGYSYQHDQGRKALEAALGDKVQTTYLESVPEADSERAIESLARSGQDLIFTTSFGFMEPTLKVARKFPKLKFEHATGYKRAPNVGTYSARFYEGRYVCGEIAARMTKTGVLGYIASFPIPEVVSGINAFMLGAQSVKPDIKVKIVWVNTWFDPGKEAEAAKALLAQGADILSQHTDSAAPLQEAEKQGKLGFGQSSDMMRFAPKAQLTSIVDDWGPHYVGAAKAVLGGTWKSADVWDGMKEGAVVLAPFANMPDDVKAAAEARTKAIKDGSFHVFTGPITKQDGTLAVKAGEVAPDPMILGMNWYVKGIDDKLPN
ncbi:basic membrane lipoprotein [Methylobacterium sp. 4-46]|uniref:BMP family ABC transporter substrate-binding protein n=1 Tax=unclassified Methylobacterium TaxID=2615210 RepID=UPI000152EAA4|nr:MULTISPECIES: BMP family ABC transporter substrate-binding protein [Methylobacterium]ACA16610.1 basic membrane lipoprotein [Methylobacterium sp. 4-46]WFT82314.1 BMP family ABC transporter substrate-binding protein [Methylobacterium nodulans]